MSELALPEEQIQDRNLEIVKLTAQGKTRQYIQSQTGVIPRMQREIVEQYKAFVRRDLWTVDRSKEIIGFMDEHYTSIIQGLYESISEAEMNDDYKSKAAFLKIIAEVEGKRVDALQKAGVFASQNVGDDMAKQQEEQDAIIEILKEVSTKWPDAGRYIAEKIGELKGEVIATRVVTDE